MTQTLYSPVLKTLDIYGEKFRLLSRTLTTIRHRHVAGGISLHGHQLRHPVYNGQAYPYPCPSHLCHPGLVKGSLAVFIFCSTHINSLISFSAFSLSTPSRRWANGPPLCKTGSIWSSVGTSSRFQNKPMGIVSPHLNPSSIAR